MKASELIGILESGEDSHHQFKADAIMEGGRKAFELRTNKYGF